MMKRMLSFAVTVLAGAGLLLFGCAGVNEPDAAAEDSSSLSESFDVTALAGQASLLSSAGVNTDSANAFFVLRWSEGLGHFQNGGAVRGHASAVAYEEPATLRDREALGLDMGEVSVLNGAGQYQLPKLVSALFGVRYGMFGGRKGPHGGPGGPRGGHIGPGGGPRGGYGPRDSLLAVVNIPFAAGGAYQFNVTGSDQIAAMALEIQAPAQLVQITGLADKDTISAAQDLTVTWEGDASVNHMVLVLAPAFKPGRFHGQPAEPVFQRLDAAAGSYTVPAQTVQDLLSAANATAISLHLSQAVVREIADANVGKILISAGSDDRVILHVE